MEDFFSPLPIRPAWEDPAISEMAREAHQDRLKEAMRDAAEHLAQLRKPLSRELLRVEKMRAQGKTSAEIAKAIGFHGPRGAGLIERHYFTEIDEKRAFWAAHPDQVPPAKTAKGKPAA